MKKLLGIVVLGLLMFANADAYSGRKAEAKKIIYIGMDKGAFCYDTMNFICRPVKKFNKNKTKYPNKYYYDGLNYEIISTKDSRFYLFKGVTSPAWKREVRRIDWGHEFNSNFGDGFLISIHDSMSAAKQGIQQHIADIARKKEEKKIAEKKRKEEEKRKIAEKQKEKKEKVEKKRKSESEDNKVIAAGSGSGFFVLKDGTVITNYHVIEGCDINKVTYKGSQSEAKVLSIDKVNDIAILKTNIIPQTVFAVSNEDVSLLEDVIVAGYPLGKQISSAIKTHKGVVTALAGAGDNYSYFQTDAAINQGNSGGPIINQKGNVVGIAVQTWVEEGVQGVHFGIKSSTLKTFASSNSLKFLAPNNRDLTNKELGKLITESTVYVECHMTIAKI